MRGWGMVFGVIILLATVVASFTDWVCMDLLVHRQYQAAPAVWRPGEGAGRIVISQVIGTLATAICVGMCAVVPGRPWLVASAAWGVGALPMALQNFQWMRISPAVTASHALGWLLRLLITACLTAWLQPWLTALLHPAG